MRQRSIRLWIWTVIFLLQLSHPSLAQICHVASIDQFPEHARVDRFRDAAGSWQPISKPEDWEVRLTDIRKQVASVMGSLPSIEKRSPPEVEWIDQSIDGSVVRKKLRYRSEEGDWVTALLLMPKGQTAPVPAMLALHQTIPIGKEEPAGMGGNPHLHYAKELAGLGYVVLAPDYPSFGEHPYAFDQNPQWASGTLKAVWDAMRGVDLLSSLSEVDAGRIGAIGHSLGGHHAIFTAFHDPRIRVVVTSCGFTRFHRYYEGNLKGWTSDRYMPRIATLHGNDPDKVPFDFPELIAGLAPRAIFVCAPLRDENFEVTGVQESLFAASQIYRLLGVPGQLQADYPNAAHDFPDSSRQAAYQFLGRVLEHHP